MANSISVPACPYYRSERRKSISCEDTYRSFSTADKKELYMAVYCEDNWRECRYAIALAEAYRRYEEGDVTALEENKIKAMEKEMKSLSSKLGRVEKKAERLQKKVDDLRGVNASFTKINNTLQQKTQRLWEKWKEEEQRREDAESKVMEQVGRIARFYEDRLAYLIDRYCDDKTLHEEDVIMWARNKYYAIVSEDDPDSERTGGRMTRAWKVVIRDAEDEDKDTAEEDGDGVQGDIIVPDAGQTED